MSKLCVYRIGVGILGALLVTGLAWGAVRQAEHARSSPPPGTTGVSAKQDPAQQPIHEGQTGRVGSGLEIGAATPVLPAAEPSSAGAEPAETSEAWRPRSDLSGHAILLTSNEACVCMVGDFNVLEERFEQAAREISAFEFEQIDAMRERGRAASVLKEHDLIGIPALVLLDGEGELVVASDIRDRHFEDCCALALRWLSVKPERDAVSLP